MTNRINIAKGSDEFPWIKIDKINGGQFQFSDDNVVNVTCVLYDSNDTVIGTYTETGSTLVFVTLSEDDDGKTISTASDDSDIFELMLIGTTTTSSATGFMKAKVTITWTNVNFPDDTYDKIIPTATTIYYLI